MLPTTTRDEDPQNEGTLLFARLAFMALIFCVSLFGRLLPTPRTLLLHLIWVQPSHFPPSQKRSAIYASRPSSSLLENTLEQVCSHHGTCLYCPKPVLILGVILSTAFVHLLQDAFDRLQDPDVRRYTRIGHWTGLIVSVSNVYSGVLHSSIISTVSAPCFPFSLSNVRPIRLKLLPL